ncbi:MAG: hypothetical protein OXC62_05915, partial [Aestuariivita sp.]|nr:hypothetical protein [Aestuariivita sp.]
QRRAQAGKPDIRAAAFGASGASGASGAFRRLVVGRGHGQALQGIPRAFIISKPTALSTKYK